MAETAVQIRGLRELRRSLRTVERAAPAELNKALRKALEPVELVASSRTPRRYGTLAGSNRIAARGATVAIVNTQPYANTIHWGRRRLRGRPSVVEGRPWIWDTLHEQRDEIGRRVIREIDLYLTRTVR